MTNPEMRCASTTLRVPDFHAECEASARQAERRVVCGQQTDTVYLLRYAADGLAQGRFTSIEEALEFVVDGAL
jgi:hypothetical protein